MTRQMSILNLPKKPKKAGYLLPLLLLFRHQTEIANKSPRHRGFLKIRIIQKIAALSHKIYALGGIYYWKQTTCVHTR